MTTPLGLNQDHTPDNLVFIKIREVIFSLKPWSQSANFYVIVIFGWDLQRAGFEQNEDNL